MGKYILNRDTSKIELHFEKADYMNLSDAQKKEIKSAFLFSRQAGAWVSRSINNHYRALKVAESLGLSDGGKVGERLSYAEELDRKSEKAEARADRMEGYAVNAGKRAESLQASFNEHRKDWSWLTQPIIAGHAGSQAFARHKNKVMARYERGLEEYKKSDYFKERAATARGTADQVKLGDKVYLSKKMKECNKMLKMYQDHIVKYEEALHKVQQGKKLTNRSGDLLTTDYIELRIADLLDKYEYEQDKFNFLEDCMNELGGVQFSKDNIKVGFIVKMRSSGRCEIVSAGPLNVTYKILEGGATGMCLTESYAAIVEILAVKEAAKIVNPFQTGEILCKCRPGDGSIYKAYQIIKTTKTGVKIQEIAVKNEIPIAGQFISDKATQKKVVKSKYCEWVGVYEDDWQLHKYEQKTATPDNVKAV